jgi:hypothetical protein
MRRSIAIVLLFLMVASAGYSQTNAVVTIGGSYWRGAFEYETMGDLGESKKETKAGNLIGPYINIRFDKLLLGSSMYFGTYDLSEEGYTDKVKRTDLNFSVGFSITPTLSLFGAYKILNATREWKVPDGDIRWDDWYQQWVVVGDLEGKMETKINYIGGGLSLVYPFTNSPLFAFGSGAYLKANKEEYNNLFAWTAGLGYHVPSGLSLMVGWRADQFLKKDEFEGTTFGGIMATLAYTLR